MLRQAGLGLLSIVLLASVAVAPRPVAAQSSPAMPSLGVALDEPGAFVGRTLTVEAQVQEVLAGQGFTVVAGDGHAQRVLVVNAPSPDERPNPWTGPWSRNWRAGDWVTLVGQLRPFDLARYEREYNVDATNAFFQPWQGRLAFFAQSVDVLNH